MKELWEDIQEGIEDIQDKIEYNKLEKKHDKLIDLKDKLNLIKKYLTDSLNDLSSVSNKVVNGYSVDGESGDDGFLENTRKNIKSTRDYLRDVVIPDIEKELKGLSDDMEDIELD